MIILNIFQELTLDSIEQTSAQGYVLVKIMNCGLYLLSETTYGYHPVHKIAQKWLPILLGLMVVGASFWFEVSDEKAVHLLHERLNNIIYDMRLTLGLPNHKGSIESDVAIVDIDDRSLNQIGRWPWPRNKVGEVIEKAREAGAIVVALDIIFAEKERNITDEIIEKQDKNYQLSAATKNELIKASKFFDHDIMLASTLRPDDIVMGFILTANPKDNAGHPPPPAVVVSPEIMKEIQLRNMPGIISNIPVLQEKAINAGFVTTLSDTDGVIRNYPIVLKHQNAIYGSLALEAVKKFLLIDKIDFEFARDTNRLILQAVNLGDIRIPTDQYGQVIIPYQGYSKSYAYYSVIDLMENKIPPNALKNKLVFIGTSAIGEGDLHTTPFETSFPGIEIHATIADIILSKSFPVQPDWAPGAIVSMILFFGLLFSFVSPFLPVLIALIFPLATISAIIYMNIWLWSAQDIYLSSVSVYLMLFFIAIVNVFYGFFFESAKRGELRAMFGQYVPSAHVDKMLESSHHYTFDGESREMSVLFADIRGFTSISEKLSPIQLKKFLNDFFTPMTKIIFDNNGTIDKYVGDMIMAFWGAPLENPNHARDAIRSGMKMIKEVKRISTSFKSMGIAEVNIGVGINTGYMNVGDMGSIYRRSYTVLGDAVNLASRLESATKFYGASMIISARTLKGTEDDIIALHLDRVKVKGKEDAVDIYEPLCTKAEATDIILNEVESNHIAQSYYYAADWSQALAAYQALKRQYPTRKIYAIYEERVKKLAAEGVRSGWDGCFVKTEK